MSNAREDSEKDWKFNFNAHTTEVLSLGCLQRIADASEKMAGNFIALQNDRDMYKRWYRDEKESGRRMARRIAALQGVITKLKNKKP